jgi:hypothetical protein
MLVPWITTRQISMHCLASLAAQATKRKVLHTPGWLNHMPVASFFTWINKFYETKEAERLADPNGTTCVTTWQITLLDCMCIRLEN